MKIPAIHKQIRVLRRLALSQRAQDLVEYALLLAFVGLGVAAMFLATSAPLVGVWNNADKHLKKGHAYAKGQDK